LYEHISNGRFCIEDYVYHTLAAKASGELCLKYIFSFGAFAKSPLLHRFDDHPLTLLHQNMLSLPEWLLFVNEAVCM
jgi:hypothetical protein